VEEREEPFPFQVRDKKNTSKDLVEMKKILSFVA
jgi:hypothetical protein